MVKIWTKVKCHVFWPTFYIGLHQTTLCVTCIGGMLPVSGVDNRLLSAYMLSQLLDKLHKDLHAVITSTGSATRRALQPMQTL